MWPLLTPMCKGVWRRLLRAFKSAPPLWSISITAGSSPKAAWCTARSPSLSLKNTGTKELLCILSFPLSKMFQAKLVTHIYFKTECYKVTVKQNCKWNIIVCSSMFQECLKAGSNCKVGKVTLHIYFKNILLLYKCKIGQVTLTSTSRMFL